MDGSHSTLNTNIRAEAAPRSGSAGPLRFLVENVLSMSPSILLASLALNLLSLLLPFVMMQVYDRVLPNNSLDTLTMLMVMVFTVTVVEAVCKEARGHVVSWSATQLAWQAHEEAMLRLSAAPPAWLNAESADRVVDRMKSLITLAEWQGSSSRLVLLDLPFVLLFFALLAHVGGPIALVPLFIVLVMLLAATRSSARVYRANERSSKEKMKIRDFLTETLRAIVMVKAGAMEAQISRRFERLQGGLTTAAYDAAVAAEESQTQVEVFGNVTQIAVVTAGAVTVIFGSLSLGALTCCTMLTGRIIQPLLRCVSLWTEVQTLIVASEKAQRIMDLPPVAQSVAHKTPEALLQAAPIELKQVTFGYEGAPPILQNATLAIPAGGVVALIGPDGLGKSTVAKLIVGHLAPQSGTVRLGGVEPWTDNAAVRGRVMSVSAENRPLRGTIIENIAMFRTGPALDAAAQAARRIGLEGDVHRLPLGFDTMMGEGAAGDLPSGLVQRIAIARALARNPSVLILDEANASTDSYADKLLIAGLRQLRGQTTILVITNRPSFAAFADAIVTIENGQFVRAASQAVPIASRSAS